MEIQKSIDRLKAYIESLTDAEIDEALGEREIVPVGWVDIQLYLPKMTMRDFLERGYTIIKVRTVDGEEFMTSVSDHHIWEVEMRQYNVTQWFNEG